MTYSIQDADEFVLAGAGKVKAICALCRNAFAENEQPPVNWICAGCTATRERCHSAWQYEHIKEANKQVADLMNAHCEKVARTRAEHIEMHAAAFVKETNLDPSECTLCEQMGKDGVMRWWFEKKKPIGDLLVQADQSVAKIDWQSGKSPLEDLAEVAKREQRRSVEVVPRDPRLSPGEEFTTEEPQPDADIWSVPKSPPEQWTCWGSDKPITDSLLFTDDVQPDVIR